MQSQKKKQDYLTCHRWGICFGKCLTSVIEVHKIKACDVSVWLLVMTDLFILAWKTARFGAQGDHLSC